MLVAEIIGSYWGFVCFGWEREQEDKNKPTGADGEII
jgi:hypothetical protein